MITQSSGGANPAAGLAMNQIGKSFANVTALNAVTLLLNPGEIHGLIGENGAGKSTLIKILAGVYQADSGSATLDARRCRLAIQRRLKRWVSASFTRSSI